MSILLFGYLPNLSFMTGVPGHAYSAEFEWVIESINLGDGGTLSLWSSQEAYDAWFNSSSNGDKFSTIVYNTIDDRGDIALELTDSPFWVGTLAGAQGLLFIIFCTLGGVLADKFTRLKVLCFGFLSVSVVFFTIGLLITLNSMPIGLLIILSSIFAALEALKVPSYLSVIADLVDKESLLNANAINFIGIGISGIIYIVRKKFSANITSILNVISITAISLIIFQAGLFYIENDQISFEEAQKLLNVPIFLNYELRF